MKYQYSKTSSGEIAHGLYMYIKSNKYFCVAHSDPTTVLNKTINSNMQECVRI